ncbi:MAG: hypothetical protein ABIH59_02305 [archaeon]
MGILDRLRNLCGNSKIGELVKTIPRSYTKLTEVKDLKGLEAICIEINALENPRDTNNENWYSTLVDRLYESRGDNRNQLILRVKPKAMVDFSKQVFQLFKQGADNAMEIYEAYKARVIEDIKAVRGEKAAYRKDRNSEPILKDGKPIFITCDIQGQRLKNYFDLTQGPDGSPEDPKYMEEGEEKDLQKKLYPHYVTITNVANALASVIRYQNIFSMGVSHGDILAIGRVKTEYYDENLRNPIV